MSEEYWQYYERTKGWSSEDRIKEIAHKLWLQQNKPQGKDVDIWLAAEMAFSNCYPWNPDSPRIFGWQL